MQLLRSMVMQPRWMFLAALTLRMAVLVHLCATRAPETMWGSNEAGMIARHLLLDHRFGSTFHDYNGLTAWLAPGYPGVVAAVFLVFGIETRMSAVALMALNAIFSSLTALVAYKLGDLIFNRATGLTAGWAWALGPMGALLPFLIWDTCLSALILSWAILTWVTANSTGGWVRSGIIWGLGGLVNPSLLAPLPLLMVCSWWRDRNSRSSALVLLSCGMLLLPWCTRNELAFHRVIPIRSNFWAEVYFGNVDFSLHPLGNSMEYQRLGEIAFVEDLKHGVVEHIRNHPARFAVGTLDRALLFWILPSSWMAITIPLAVGAACGLGLAIRNTGSRSLPILLPLLSYPVIYCISYVYARYRHPIEPFMYILAAYAACEGMRVVRKAKARVDGAAFCSSTP